MGFRRHGGRHPATEDRGRTRPRGRRIRLRRERLTGRGVGGARIEAGARTLSRAERRARGLRGPRLCPRRRRLSGDIFLALNMQESTKSLKIIAVPTSPRRGAVSFCKIGVFYKKIHNTIYTVLYWPSTTPSPCAPLVRDIAPGSTSPVPRPPNAARRRGRLLNLATRPPDLSIAGTSSESRGKPCGLLSSTPCRSPPPRPGRSLPHGLDGGVRRISGNGVGRPYS